MRGIVLVIYSMACCAAQHTCSCTPCTDDCPPDRTSTFTCQDSSADMQAAHAMNHFSEVIDRLHLYNISSRKTHDQKRNAFACDLRLIVDHWKRLDKENYPSLKPLEGTKDEERVNQESSQTKVMLRLPRTRTITVVTDRTDMIPIASGSPWV